MLSVAVAAGKELVSVTDPGIASVVLSATPVEVAEACVTVAGLAALDASEAEALERMLEMSEANEEEMALSVTTPTTLDSSEAMLDRAPPKSPVAVAVGPSDEVWVAPVVSAEAKEETPVSRAA